MDVEEIIEDYPDSIFDSPDPHARTKMTEDEVSHLPQVDDSGKPIHLYCEKGYPIQRRMAIFSPEARPYGVLIKSENLQTLFTHNIDNYNVVEGVAQAATVLFTFYPQAGLRTVGHFQASGLIAACYPVLAQINRSISEASIPTPLSAASEDADFDMDDEDTAGGVGAGRAPVSYKTIVHPISSQGYNAVTHSTRGRTAQHHEVQTGRVTGALAGAWAAGNHTNVNTAYELATGCELKMPHEAFADKIKNPEISRDLRLENVYWIDMDTLSMDDQNGRSVSNPLVTNEINNKSVSLIHSLCRFLFTEVLLPLTKIWTHGSLIHGIGKHVEVFKPDVSRDYI